MFFHAVVALIKCVNIHEILDYRAIKFVPEVKYGGCLEVGEAYLWFLVLNVKM